MTRAAIALAAALAVSACGASRTVAIAPATTRHAPPHLSSGCRTISAAIFETPEFERSFWSVLVQPADVGRRSLLAQRREADDAGLEHEDADAGGRGRAARLGLSLRDANRVVRSARRRRPARRSRHRRQRRSEHQRAQRRARHPESDCAQRARRAASADRRTDHRRRRPLRRHGFGDGWTSTTCPMATPRRSPHSNTTKDRSISSFRPARQPAIRSTFRCGRTAAVFEVDNRLVDRRRIGHGRAHAGAACQDRRALSSSGQIPAKAAPFATTASVDNPTEFFASAFRAALIAEGIQVNGDAVDIDDFLTKPDLTRRAGAPLASFRCRSGRSRRR